ncbi:SDR family NAD(P)-dependent oxidoreductase [Vibrio penaeicida]|uniref:SDR family NAD(P)-dependent oxidoreductase n=1 Tax=Vibrio penaeicida TaxID=104609 RepID=UPI000CE9E7FC|nr:SDR family oxidoreductase [Vibrio penaeicida]
MKNVVITGACSGMGLSATKLFLERGWGVVMADLSEEAGAEHVKQFKAAGHGNVWFYCCNIGKREDVEKLALFTFENAKHVDCVINNAGIWRGGELHDTSEEDWDAIFDVDVKSVFLTTRSFVPKMIENGGGTIVNTASVSGLYGDYSMAAYNAAKGSVVNLTRAMALDYGKYNIRVNSVCPSACATPMFLANPEDVVDLFNKKNPLGRICTPDEVAEAMYFLATEASRSCNGVNLPISGGMDGHTGQPVQ